MYRVAVIQNDSEMTRYGWADIRPLLARMSDYHFKFLTAEHLPELIADLRLSRYDAIVIATNACNDQTVHDCLQADVHKQQIQNFLQAGGGAFISFQMRLTGVPSYGFLPSPFDVAATNRRELGTDGSLKIPLQHRSNIVFTHPHDIDADMITRHCLNNEFVRSLYRGYLRPLSEGAYDGLLMDDSHQDQRPLLLASRTDFPGRLVISALPLDWQGHDLLLENIIRYITAGHPNLALLGAKGRNTFDFRYLASSLETRKIPFSQSDLTELGFDKINFSIHNTVVLDPAWTYADLLRSNYGAFADHFRSGAKLFYFSQMTATDPVVSYIGGLRNVHLILPSTIAWIRAQYKGGRWGGSFWHTFDVLETFIDLGIGVSEYRDDIIENVKPHNIGGSYDEVLGATCALLKVYKWLLGASHPEFLRTLKWIRERLPEASLYELATAIDTLNEVGFPASPNVVEGLHARILERDLTVDDDLRLYRYGRTLLSSGWSVDALAICRGLAIYQTDTGGWMNVARTASIALLLMRIQQLKPLSTEPALDDMIFRAITFLKSNYSSDAANWHNDIPATAKALKAVLEFERRLSYPIDELVSTLEFTKQKTREFRAIEVATAHTSRLQAEQARLKGALDDQSRRLALAGDLAGGLSWFSFPLYTILVLILAHGIWTGQVVHFFYYIKTFIQDWTFVVSSTVLFIPFILIYFVLRALNRIPRLRLIPEEWEETVLRLVYRKYRLDVTQDGNPVSH